MILCPQAWHAYAYMNYEAVLFYKQLASGQDQLEGAGDIGKTSDDTGKVCFLMSSTRTKWSYNRQSIDILLVGNCT